MARTSGRALLPVVLISAAFAATGCGDSPAATEQPLRAEDSIVGGEVDTEHRHVFMLVTIAGNYYQACTATLIAPNLLLTARHCISSNEDEVVICGRSDLGPPLPATSIRASNAVNVQEARRWYEGASVHVPQEGSDTCGYDVALVVLTENVPASVAVPAVPRIDREVAEGEPYVAVGYGLDEQGEQGGRLMREGLFVSCAPGECGRVAPAGEFIGDTGVCQGDSGGPAFDAAGKVVGIVSRGG
ncbi:MAG TPA: S1 family peptidase, partial [Polyangiaceae bacterium]